MKTLSLNNSHVKAICSAIRRGLSRQDAADKAGVHRDTIYDWLKRGSDAVKKRDEGEALDQDEMRLVGFYFACKKAVRLRKLALLKRIETASSNHEVAANTWLLEVFAPDEFGKRTKHEVTGAEGGPIEHTATVRVIDLPPIHDAASLAD